MRAEVDCRGRAERVFVRATEEAVGTHEIAVLFELQPVERKIAEMADAPELVEASLTLDQLWGRRDVTMKREGPTPASLLRLSMRITTSLEVRSWSQSE